MRSKNEFLEFVQNNFEYEEDDVLDIGGYKRYSSEVDMRRKDLVKKYAWGIPNQQAVELIVENDPVVEIGAGSGYWAYLVDEGGGDILAFDNNDREYEEEWFNVNYGSAEIATEFPDRSLFLCWPEYHNEMGEIAVENYDGQCIILVGESISGCTGTTDMYRMIESTYELENTIEIPNWFGIRDKLHLYKRS